MKKRSIFVFSLITICLTFIFWDVSSLYAQQSGTDEFTLDEITVTAQKREENQQKVAIAMEVISADEIKELGKNDIDEILQGVSNTLIEKSQEGYRITIRGITDNSEAYKGQSMAPPAVAVNIDGVYSNRKDTGAGLFDLERVEVLYGPQTTMYMSNSPGGVVNVVSANPKTDRYEASGSLEYGNFSLLHTEGAMNAPITDKVAMRASFATSKRDGYLSNGLDDEDTKSARLKTLFKPSDKFSVVLTGETSRNAGLGFGSGVQIFDYQDGYWYEASEEMRGAYVKTGKVTDPWIGTDWEATTNNSQVTKKIYAQINWDTPAGGISLTPAYTKRRGSSSFKFDDPDPAPPEISHMIQSAEEKSIELRMTNPEDFLFKWIVGVTYYDAYDRGLDRSETYLNSGPVVREYTDLDGETKVATFPHWGRMSDREMTNKNKAIYINITYPITDVFRATAGYRKSWDKMVSDNEEMRGGPGLPAGEVEYLPEMFIMENPGKPDYNLGFEYDFGDNTMLYTNYKTSYRVQGMGGGPPGTVATNEPEKLKAYTLGAKNRFFENKLEANAAAYYYDYRNYRAGGNDFSVWVEDTDNDGVPDTGRDSTEVFGQRNTNGTGNGRMIGLDLSFNAILSRNDKVNLTASYIKSEWTDLILNYYYPDILEYVDGVLTQIHRPTEDFKGKQMMNSPAWNINLTYDHNFNLPNGGSIKAGITVKYKTAYDLSWRKVDYPINYQEAYHMEDVNLVYNHSDGKWSLSGYCKNLTNYAEKRALLNMGGNKLLSIGNPRTYGGVLSVKF